MGAVGLQNDISKFIKALCFIGITKQKTKRNSMEGFVLSMTPFPPLPKERQRKSNPPKWKEEEKEKEQMGLKMFTMRQKLSRCPLRNGKNKERRWADGPGQKGTEMAKGTNREVIFISIIFLCIKFSSGFKFEFL